MTADEVIEKYNKISEERKKRERLEIEAFNKLKTYELLEDYYEENSGFTGPSVRYKVLNKGTKLKCMNDFFTDKKYWGAERYGSRIYGIPKSILKEL